MSTRPLPPLLLRGDCIARMRDLPDASIDAIVTDPPYGLDFMGKDWDSAVKLANGMLGQIAEGLTKSEHGPLARGGTHSQGYKNHDGLAFELWVTGWAAEALRVLKPGGHLLAFGGSRTWHRLAAGIEDAGFEVRDSIAWLYGSGFPKSLDVAKALDAREGIIRGAAGAPISENGSMSGVNYERTDKGAAVTESARAWEGWGTALKPAFEPIVVARKPLAGTVAANVLQYGTGALNIDASRIGTTVETWPASRSYAPGQIQPGGKGKTQATGSAPAGRWPANVMLDESQAAALDAQAPKTGAAAKASGPTLRGRHDTAVAYGARNGLEGEPAYHGDSGGASRFFYVAKAPKSERPVTVDDEGKRVAHPTVKPLALMRYLVTLVTPPGGVVLDPFAGSGTTLEAAHLAGFESIGVELTPDYWPLIEARIERAVATRAKAKP